MIYSMSDYLDPNNEELLKDFFVEAEMQLEVLEQNILVLENDTSNEDAIDEIFRAAHTLKGASATVQMSELAEFTHIVEDVLDDIRGGKLRVGEDTVDILLKSLDIIKEMLSARGQGSVYEKDISGVASALGSLQAKMPSTKPGKAEVPAAPTAEAKQPTSGSTQSRPATDAQKGISEYEMLELKEAAGENETIYAVTVEFDESNPMNTVGGIQVFAALKSVGSILKTEPEFDRLYEDNFYPTVVYYVASSEAPEDLRRRSTISDVTLSSLVAEVVVGDTGEARAASSQGRGVESSSKEVESADRGKVQASAETASAKRETGVAATRPQDAPSTTEEKVDLAETVAETGKKQNIGGGSVLRVESKRIDDLLNLVSETVINKATFNQVNSQFTENLNLLQQVQSSYRQMVKDLFDGLPDYLERIERGSSVKDIKRDILSNYGDLLTIFDGVQTSFKNSINKFRSTAQNLGRITSELQEGVMRIRMVPISQIFSRFPRLVRDLSKSLNKKVNLKIEGEDTELDKSVIEDLLDPLIHCVRNSLDHGIESNADRKKSGKSEEGTLLLKASNEGNMILIEIFDDGRGIDVEKVKSKAIDRGLIHPSKVLTDVEAFNLIFEPGFSTAAQITNISGRGVGLDVVKKQIEKLNGTVSVNSNFGRGTRFTIKIPLTLAIIQGLLVRVGKEMYAIPITAVLDSHRIKPAEIKRIDNYEVFNVRDDVVSLMRLNRIFGIQSDEQKDHYFVVIVGSSEKKMGLIVDALIGEEDVVIKPLRDHYTNAPGIAGANITGDGTVSLIIDVSQLLELGQKQEREARLRREASPAKG